MIVLHAEGVVRRKASNVAFNIMHTSVMGSPVMDALRYDGSRRCYDRRTLIGYSSYDSEMIRTTNLPSAGWASLVRANISTVINTCADIFVQLISTQGRAAQMCNVVAVVC